jgi:hypothetical protein
VVPFGYKISMLSMLFCPWFPKYLPKVPSDLFYGEICSTKLKVFIFFRWNLYGTLRMSNFKIFSIFLVLDPKKVTKNIIKFVLWGNLLNKIEGFYLS